MMFVQINLTEILHFIFFLLVMISTFALGAFKLQKNVMHLELNFQPSKLTSAIGNCRRNCWRGFISRRQKTAEAVQIHLLNVLSDFMTKQPTNVK